MWKKRLVIKIFKKGDVHDWRRVTLLLITSKIFCRMLLQWITIVYNRKLQKDQAALRLKRSTVKQTFKLEIF